jgi:hypothetical protein
MSEAEGAAASVGISAVTTAGVVSAVNGASGALKETAHEKINVNTNASSQEIPWVLPLAWLEGALVLITSSAEKKVESDTRERQSVGKNKPSAITANERAREANESELSGVVASFTVTIAKKYNFEGWYRGRRLIVGGWDVSAVPSYANWTRRLRRKHVITF